MKLRASRPKACFGGVAGSSSGVRTGPRVEGTPQDDIICGGGADAIVGMGGADVHKGAAGNDPLDSRDGAEGNDTVNGGGGTDTCTTDATEKSVTKCEQ